MDQVSNEALEVGRQRSGRLTLLWDLHAGVLKLNNEVRARAQIEGGRGSIAPPFDLQLNTARKEVTDALPRLDTLSGDPAWAQLRKDLSDYVDMTQDPKSYSLKGFEQFHIVDKELNALFQSVQLERDGVIDRVLVSQRASRRSIISWTVIALLVGALVAAGTIWQMQRHFSEMRRSMFETRRERTFNTQLLQGMVSAVAAIDNDDRIRSANAAFFRIFPNASIGASVLEKLGPEDAMMMLETVTAIRVTKAT